MKITKIAAFAMTALAAFVLPSCAPIGPEEEPAKEPVADFTVAKGDVEAEYAEVVVRHNGLQDVTWFGFVTEDVQTPADELIAEKIATLDRKDLHVGTSQTVALRNLQEAVNYRYIAFAVNEQNVYYGTAGSLTFNTSPKFDVEFSLEATSVLPHDAFFNASHNGNEILTYWGFITEDMESDVDALVAANTAEIVTDGKLNPGVTLLKGSPLAISASELTHETAYRYIIYGIYDFDGVVISYGTPAECLITTPIDLNIVSFSAVASNITKNSVDFAVEYSAKQEDLTWYGFYTTDVTTPASALIVAETAGLSPDKWQTGAQKVQLSGLTPETDYRYIVTGINADGIYGIPADVKFSSLSEAYDNTVFTVTAGEITPYTADLVITHNGHEDFEYCGFLTEDLESPVSEIPVPAGADQHLMKGLETTVVLADLTARKEYRYIVVGRVYGNDYGTRGEVFFTTGDDAVSLAYTDFLGEWKINGAIVTITPKVNGSSYNIDGFPGSGSTRGGVSAIVGNYDSATGQLYVEDQDLAQYDDPSTNNYGPLKDFFSGAVWETMSDGSQEYWPNYPFGTSEKNRIFNFVGMADGTFELRPAEGVEATIFGWVILTGSYAGRGNTYSTYVELPATVEKLDKVAASYADFLGNWNFGSDVITISQQQNGSTYSITGFFGQDEIFGDVKVVTGNYDAAKHEFYIMEQKLGAFNTADVEAFGSNQYGWCDDHLSGYFPYGSSGYFAYPFNTNAPVRIFTAYLNHSGEMEVTPGSCTYGTFSAFDFIWVIREGEYAGQGNNYNGDYGTTIPEKITKAGSTSSVPSVSGKPATAPKAADKRAAKAAFRFKLSK